MGAYGDGVWSVSRCSVLVDMVYGVSGDVGRLWKWCNTGVAYGMYSAQSTYACDTPPTPGHTAYTWTHHLQL